MFKHTSPVPYICQAKCLDRSHNPSDTNSLAVGRRHAAPDLNLSLLEPGPPLLMLRLPRLG